MAGFFDRMKQEPVGPDEAYPLFNRAGIETTSHCNRSCGFCPISRGTREARVLMDWRLVEKVAGELGDLGFDGVISAFLLNEPLLDPRIHDVLRLLGTRAPRASIFMSTNADPLGKDPEKAAEKLHALFMSGLTVVNLNAYDGGEEGVAQLERYRRMLELLRPLGVEETGHRYRHHNPRRSYVAITDMRPEVLANHSAVNAIYRRISSEKTGETRGYCARPHRNIVVEHDGRVPLCCVLDPTDLSAKAPRVGDVNHQSLVEAWNVPEFRKYRWFLQQGRRDLPACRGCDYRMAYAHVVRRVSDPSPEERAAWEREADPSRPVSRAVSLRVLP